MGSARGLAARHSASGRSEERLKLRKIVTSPWAHLGWLAFLVTAFLAAYRADPFVYGFTVLGLAWVSGIVVGVGIFAIVLEIRSGRRGIAALIGASTLATAATVIAALRILQGIRWA